VTSREETDRSFAQKGVRSTSTAESDEIRYKARRGFRKSQENGERERERE
jgi:hypothetical protein